MGHTEHEEQCHDELVEECKTEYTEECQDEPEEKCHTETSQECTTEYDEVCSIDYADSCHPEWVEKCKEVPDCRTEWQEGCHVKEDAKPKFTKWKRHAVDEMETADVEEESLEGRQKRSLATAAAVFWCWSCQGYCCWCCCRRRHWWSCPSWCYWLWPWKESGSWGQEAGADQDRLGAEEEGTVWQVCRRTRGGGNCGHGHGKTEGAVRGCRRRAWYCGGGSNLPAEAHDTWSSWACRCTGRRCCWCCTSGCCRWCWTSGGRSLRQETWLQGWSSTYLLTTPRLTSLKRKTYPSWARKGSTWSGCRRWCTPSSPRSSNRPAPLM